MSVLDTIVAQKKVRIEAAKYQTPLLEMISALHDVPPARNFMSAVQGTPGHVRLIAEIKKGSPSKGLIRKDFDHLLIARTYESKKVDAISVLTEEDFFHGRLEYLSDAKAMTTRPILRKDFIVDEYQVVEARVHGADAILLIAALLEISQAQDFYGRAEELGMAVLFEVHDEHDLEKALRINAKVIGINNRNLKTLQIDLNTTFVLKRDIPPGKIIVSESGIQSRDDVLKLQEAGIDAMLIGTSFMASEDIAEKIDDLLGIA